MKTTLSALFLLVLVLVVPLPSSAAVPSAQDMTTQRQSMEIAVATPDEPTQQNYTFPDDFNDPDHLAVADPFEPWNRFWFQFNDRFYFWIFKPLAQGYKAVTPEEMRQGVENFFHNAMFPMRFLNLVLQGKLMGAGVEAQRFLANTAFGGLGLLDVTKGKKAVVEPDEEDFGQTLGSYGAGNGPYIVWPILGPSTLRDTFGMVADYFSDPFSYLKPWYASTGVKSYRRLNNTTFHLGEYETLKKSAVEPYSAMRDAYIQYRWEKVRK